MNNVISVFDKFSRLAANTRWDLVPHRIYRILEKSLYRGGTPHCTNQFCKDELGPDFRYTPK